MKKLNFSFLKRIILSITCCFIFCCYSTPVYATSTSTNLDTDWKNRPTGSVDKLEGRTLLVSIFFENCDSSWNPETRRNVKYKLDQATDFIINEADMSYGKKVDFVYDYYEHTDLVYHYDYGSSLNTSYESSSLFNAVYRYIDSNIPVEDLLTTYDANSIGFMCFVNQNGTSYACPMPEEPVACAKYEIAFFFSHYNNATTPASAYAHELLHLFGAKDLYRSSQEDGISKELAQYAIEHYPFDVMLASWPDYKHTIQSEISPITAYYLGLIDTIPELELFPSISMQSPGVFTILENPPGDYTPYTYGENMEEVRYLTDMQKASSRMLMNVHGSWGHHQPGCITK